MALALRMGRTLSELKHHMTASELLLWIEYDKTSPIDDVRSDIQSAQIVSAIYGSQGVKVPIQEAIIKWERDIESEEDVDNQFAGLESFLTQAAR